jgi:hypothetical protein
LKFSISRAKIQIQRHSLSLRSLNAKEKLFKGLEVAKEKERLINETEKEFKT